MDDRTQNKAGQIMGAIAIICFVGSWAVKAVVERKSPSGFEVGFALINVYAFYSDPKKAMKVGIGAIGRMMADSSEEIISHEEN